MGCAKSLPRLWQTGWALVLKCLQPRTCYALQICMPPLVAPYSTSIDCSSAAAALSLYLQLCSILKRGEMGQCHPKRLRERSGHCGSSCQQFVLRGQSTSGSHDEGSHERLTRNHSLIALEPLSSWYTVKVHAAWSGFLPSWQGPSRQDGPCQLERFMHPSSEGPRLVTLMGNTA